MNRRDFLISAAAAAFLPGAARANVPLPYDWNASPPTTSREAFVEWMVKNRGENAGFLASVTTAIRSWSPPKTSGTPRSRAPI